MGNCLSEYEIYPSDVDATIKAFNSIKTIVGVRTFVNSFRRARGLKLQKYSFSDKFYAHDPHEQIIIFYFRLIDDCHVIHTKKFVVVYY